MLYYIFIKVTFKNMLIKAETHGMKADIFSALFPNQMYVKHLCAPRVCSRLEVSTQICGSEGFFHCRQVLLITLMMTAF